MVSEYPASDGYRYAAYQRNVEYVNPDGYQAADITLNTANVPSYMGDDSVPGLSGLYAGSFKDENGVTHGYTTSTTTAAGGSGWGTYFYFGTSGSY